MSQLKNVSELELDFSKGFSWHAVIRVLSKKDADKKIIYQAAHESTPVSLTIGLDNENDLYLWLIDAKGKEFVSEAIPKEKFLDKFIYLTCEVSSEEGKVRLRLGINNEYIREKLVEADLGGNQKSNNSIGSDLDGNNGATFELGELILIQNVLDTQTKEALYQYVKNKWGI